jgi:hypothetical protein
MFGRDQGLGVSYEEEVAFLLPPSKPCPPPTPLRVRQRIHDLSLAGLAPKTIACLLAVPLRTVRRLVRRCQQQPHALQPDYHNAGRPLSEPFLALREQVLALRRLHPRWGAGRILVQLLRTSATRPLPEASTVRRWLRQAGLAPPKPPPAPAGVPVATEPHQIWQMDAAEKVPLRTPQQVCWLRLVDEGSGAVLFSLVFAQACWAEVGAAAVQTALRQAFSRWGRPQGLRVDNGVPWVNQEKLPSELELWLGGLDVALHRIKPRRPQENGKVERSQGTAKNWAEPSQCDSPEQLQSRLDEEDRIQRELYPVAEGQSRLERYPSLRHSGRAYAAGTWEQVCWCLEDALQCLGRFRGKRKVDKAGDVSLYDRRQRVGVAYAGQDVEVRLDPTSREWVFSQEKQEVGRSAMTPLSAEAICQLRTQRRPGRSAARTRAKRARTQGQRATPDAVGPRAEAASGSSL